MNDIVNKPKVCHKDIPPYYLQQQVAVLFNLPGIINLLWQFTDFGFTLRITNRYALTYSSLNGAINI